MTSESSQDKARILALENLVNALLARQNSDESRLASLEQTLSKAFGQAGGGGSISSISPAVAGAGGIAAGSSANVTLQTLSGGSLVAGQTVLCNNNFATAVGASKAMQVGRDQNGNYWALSWDC